jgi:hypothetical protein
MVKRKTEFLLLTCHTDDEITDFLQRNAEENWWLVGNKGNRFEFEARQYQGRRICSYSFFSHDLETSTEEQLRRELPLLRRKGWDMICISGPENVTDSTRHAFLYDEHPNAESPKPIPKSDNANEARSVRCSRRKSVSNLLICILFLAFALMEYRNDLFKIVSSNFYLASSLIVSILLLASIAVSFVAAVHSFCSMALRKKRPYMSRFLDIGARLTLLVIAVLCFVLISLSLWSGVQGHGTRIDINGSKAIVYSDEIPIGLKELGIDTTGAYRSSIWHDSSSLIASYSHGSDEILDEAADCISFVSYHRFSSRFGFLRRIAVNQLFHFQGQEDSNSAMNLGFDSMWLSSDEKSILISSGIDVMVINSGESLSKNAIDLISRSLLNR